MKKLQTVFLTFCDYASIDQQNKLSIIGIFDEIKVQQFPGGIARAFLVGIVSGEPLQSQTITMRGELEGKVLFPELQHEIMISPNGQSNIIVDMANIGFPKAGKYEFVLYFEGKVIGKTAINVGSLEQRTNGKKLTN